jgi:P27 family predicted phage terminase small subunit
LTAPAFALYCDAWSRYVAASAELDAKGMLIETRRGLSVSKKLNPVMAILRESLKTLMLLGSHFGLTPYARRKLGPVEATDLDALESLDAEFS